MKPEERIAELEMLLAEARSLYTETEVKLAGVQTAKEREAADEIKKLEMTCASLTEAWKRAAEEKKTFEAANTRGEAANAMLREENATLKKQLAGDAYEWSEFWRRARNAWQVWAAKLIGQSTDGPLSDDDLRNIIGKKVVLSRTLLETISSLPAGSLRGEWESICREIRGFLDTRPR